MRAVPQGHRTLFGTGQNACDTTHDGIIIRRRRPASHGLPRPGSSTPVAQKPPQVVQENPCIGRCVPNHHCFRRSPWVRFMDDGRTWPILNSTFSILHSPALPYATQGSTLLLNRLFWSCPIRSLEANRGSRCTSEHVVFQIRTAMLPHLLSVSTVPLRGTTAPIAVRRSGPRHRSRACQRTPSHRGCSRSPSDDFLTLRLDTSSLRPTK